MVASLYESGNLINLYLDRNKEVGSWFQRRGNIAGLVSTVLLIWLVFASKKYQSSHIFVHYGGKDLGYLNRQRQHFYVRSPRSKGEAYLKRDTCCDHPEAVEGGHHGAIGP